MTKKIPQLGGSLTRDGSVAQPHECHHCGQQLPQHMLNQTATQTTDPAPVASPVVAPATATASNGFHKSGTMEDDVPDPDVAVPESSTREAPAATSSNTTSHELPHSPSHGPEMWLADCLSAIEHKVGDFITHFDHTLAGPASSPEYSSAGSRSVPANPPSYDSATSSEKAPVASETKQGNGPARNAQAQMKGHYHCSSHSMMLKDGHILSANCADPNGKHLLSTIDLNDCLTNDNAVLKWKVNGNFKASARNARLCDDGKCLELEIKNHHGQWRFDKFDLSERIENRNGKLVFLKPWISL